MEFMSSAYRKGRESTFLISNKVGRDFKWQIKTFRGDEAYNFPKRGDDAWVYVYVRLYQIGYFKYLQFGYVSYTSTTLF